MRSWWFMAENHFTAGGVADGRWWLGGSQRLASIKSLPKRYPRPRNCRIIRKSPCERSFRDRGVDDRLLTLTTPWSSQPAARTEARSRREKRHCRVSARAVADD